ncbi:MAG: hypothetical protein F4Z81_10905 [Gemmatimonadetes bacterium]|nr:hypothetical protein [Gemmatimonadota bacterium]MYB62288.1 hypothetical protein [Gemmatimonadota bacterium]
MSLDRKITEAIEAAVAEAGQPPRVAKRLIAWFESLNSGSEEINDASQAKLHLEVLYEGTVVSNENHNNKTNDKNNVIDGVF